jgi:hypothetical protein
VSSGEFLGETIDVVEIAVGFVLVLLVKLRLVESLVVELGWLWSRRLSGTNGVSGDFALVDRGLSKWWSAFGVC